MIKKLIEVINKRKRLFGTIAVVVVFIILVALGIDTSVKDNLSHLPFFYKNKPEQSGASKLKTRGNLVLVNVSPPDNYRGESYDNVGTIVFTFNLPLDEKSLKYIVTPNVNLETGVYKNTPTKLWIKPLTGTGWYVGIEHKIVINDLASTSGDYIGKKIEYTYLTNPPKILENLPD